MKWEYKHISSNHPLTKYELNSEGIVGWELVNVIVLNGKFCHTFKRETFKETIADAPNKIYAKYSETELTYGFDVDKYPSEGSVEYIRMDTLLNWADKNKRSLMLSPASESTGIKIRAYDLLIQKLNSL